ncbi:hypothetical protein P691DRAFT_771299 [Macrolepiota fuliginosa MF-IS2]|uniref:F-box domain-containing protein n=1 Tax=Macrolepiota fuliginosa MF-IS2 TaxID=1400762 RepID=A0A9P5XQM5_9AGAR|nr:hypothetical protein P691DRAFT_771299 [Macrolepiota fuliginosa MF-IS2]
MLSKTSTHPLPNLPIDILYLIFDIYQSIEQSPHPGLRLTQVCSHWRYAGLDSSRLWNNFCVSLKTPIPIISLYLQRSRNTPLIIDCDLRHAKRLSNSPEVVLREAHCHSLIWSLVTGAASRWQHLSLRFDSINAPAIIRDLAHVSTPTLRRLLLWTNLQSCSDLHTFGNKILNLEVLSLRGVPFHPFISGALGSVKRLELSINHAISLKDFRGAMERMPGLEYLSLRGDVVVDWPIQLGEEPIYLPSLRSLSLAEQRVPLAVPLLSISAPLLYDITFVDLTTRDLPSGFTSTLLRQNYMSIRSLVLSGGASELIDDTFRHLFSIFPKLDHLGLIQVNEFIVQELTSALQHPGVWPQLQTIFTSTTPGGDNVIASQHSSPCEWDITHLSVSTPLTRSEWLKEFSW